MYCNVLTVFRRTISGLSPSQFTYWGDNFVSYVGDFISGCNLNSGEANLIVGGITGLTTGIVTGCLNFYEYFTYTQIYNQDTGILLTTGLDQTKIKIEYNLYDYSNTTVFNTKKYFYETFSTYATGTAPSTLSDGVLRTGYIQQAATNAISIYTV